MISVRAACEDDFNFLIATWLNFFYKNSYFTKRIRKSIYFLNHEKIVKNLLRKETARIVVAYPTELPEVIFGFLAYEEETPECSPIIHFAFSKEELRGKGIFTQMYKHAGIHPNHCRFSHWTMDMNDLIRKYPEAIYDPYRI